MLPGGQMEPVEIIDKVYGAGVDKNWITLLYGALDPLMAYELRESIDNRGKVYQIRVASYSPRSGKAVPETDLSKTCSSLQEAQAWIEEITVDIHEARSFHKAC